MEQWIPVTVPHFKKFFAISSEGGVARYYPWFKVLKPRIGTKRRRYYKVNLSCSQFPQTFEVHRLVALAFLGPPKSRKYTTDHINRDRLDNRACNLRYVTRKGQYRNSWRHFERAKYIPRGFVSYRRFWRQVWYAYKAAWPQPGLYITGCWRT